MNRWQDKSVPQIIEMGRPDAAYAITKDDIDKAKRINSIILNAIKNDVDKDVSL